ncbi:MAG: dephospho-CoA kinase [Thermococcaceae archaeon]|nr:dephospho-CoA kinase [Thermococcaceae archaeon]
MARMEAGKMIIGVVGKIAAGKTTVAKFFEEKGFCRVSCSDPLIDLLTHNVSDYSWIPELPEKAEPTRWTRRGTAKTSSSTVSAQ